MEMALQEEPRHRQQRLPGALEGRPELPLLT